MANGILAEWRNGETAANVKEVIDYNFRLLYERTKITEGFYKLFYKKDWRDGVITINYSDHRISNPSPQILMIDSGKYINVLGGFYVDSKGNIILESDIPYDGKVVVK